MIMDLTRIGHLSELSDLVSNNEINIKVVKPDWFWNDLMGKESNNRPFYLVSSSTTDSGNTAISPHCPGPQSTVGAVGDQDEFKSFIGSPMKLDAIANLSLSDLNTSTSIGNTMHKKGRSRQLSIKLTRKILNRYLLAPPVDPEATSMLYVLCDGEDRQCTVLMGAAKEVRDHRLVKKTFLVTASKTNLASVDKLCAASKSAGKTFQMKCKHTILDCSEGLGSIVLEVNWSDSNGSVKIPHLNLADFVLHVCVTPGSEQSPVYSYNCLLQKVCGLLEGLKAGELPAVLTNKPVDGSAKLLELFARIKKGVIENTNAFENYGQLSVVTKELKLDPTSDLDFTDLLWNILSACSTFKEIVHCLEMTFLELRKGELQFFVHSENQTTLAKLIRQSYAKNAAFLSLTGRLPLLIMVELGLEFMRKNYSAVFMNSKLCTKEEWACFFHALTPHTDSVADMEELGIGISQGLFDILNKLHHCLELVTVVNAFTEKQDLCALAKAVMSYYKTNSLDVERTFSFPITAMQANPEMNRAPLNHHRRECFCKETSVVENVFSECPDVFDNASLSVSRNSTCTGEKEYFYFKTQESISFLQVI